MRNIVSLLTTLTLVLMISDQVYCGKILILVPAPSYSHQIVHHAMALALHKRGHEIVIVTANPRKDIKLANYTQVDFSVAYTVLDKINQKITNYLNTNMLEMYRYLYEVLHDLSDHMFKLPEIQKICKNNGDNFDVIIVESSTGFAPMALGYKFNIPLIGIITQQLHMYNHFSLGNVLLPSHLSNWEFHDTTGGKDLSFWTKLMNFKNMFHLLYDWFKYSIEPQTDIARKYLGDDIPSVLDIASHLKLQICNYDPVLDVAMPLPPNVINVDSFHIEDKPSALTPVPHMVSNNFKLPSQRLDILGALLLIFIQEINEFIGNATDGFIYMSLGTNVKSSMMSREVVKGLYNAFSKLPCRVIWKFETDYLPRKKGNILTSKWIPQQNVLAHPNIKLFIFQGGVQSTEETIHNGVPIVGIPVMFDQMYRIRRLVTLGAGKQIEFTKLNEKVFYETVYEVLTNERYKRNMMELKALKHDKPYNSKDHAVWWVEYVMRHKTATHLRFTEADYPWYQRQNADVIAFLSIILFLVTIVCMIVLVQSIRWIYKTWLRESTKKALYARKNKKND
ncbi:UDP-glycosyltransferase UGT5-like [Calliopsis andreniformis]|uniref:UDP-glycosyltransferase UGT5-like n=1 Tax=Calliopsis andreniformis TaxID=337506 RepID=UPI003FCD9D44